MVSVQLNSFWQKATGKVLVRVNAASFRKAAVFTIHEEHEHLKKDPADLMGHNQKTTEKFYLIRQKEKTVAKTSEALRNIMYGTNQKDTDKEEEQLPDEVMSQQMSSREHQSDGKLGSGRHRWTDEENESVKSAFETAIKEKSINIQTVKGIIQGHKILSKINKNKILGRLVTPLGLFRTNLQHCLGDFSHTACYAVYN